MSESHDELVRRDTAFALHPYTDLAEHEKRGPLIIDRGEGIYVWDTQGKRYIEGLSGLWCTGLGFSEPRLVEAARRQMDALPFAHSFSHRAAVPTIELSERLMATAPKKLSRAFFVNSGSEAVDSAIKFVWYYNNALDRPDKKKIIARQRAYHGVTVAAGSLTGLPFVQAGFDLPIDRFLHTDAPHYYRGANAGEDEDAYASRLADQLEQLILEEGPETIAGFIAEPIMGAGGVLVPPKTYFEKIQRVLKRYEILMIADEVICGFGRTGNMWGCETYGIEPDLLTCAKQLSSAYLPIGAVLVSDEIYQGFVEYGRSLGAFGTGNTYGGHPVAAAVALETLKIYEERDIVGQVRERAEGFQRRIQTLSDHPLVGHARGAGFIGGIELVSDKSTKTPFPPERKAAAYVNELTVKNGLFLRPLPGDTVGICPPLISTEAELDEIFRLLTESLDEAQERLLGE